MTAERMVSAEVFEPLIGTSFGVAASDGAVPVTLRTVTRLPALRAADAASLARAVAGGARQHPFKLLFDGASYLPQGMYRFQCDVLDGGAIEIFIVPVGREADRFVYEAVFG